MEKLIAVLNEMRPNIDFYTHEALVDDRVLKSFDIISLIALIADEFDVVIPPNEIVPENFNSASKMYELIERLNEA